MRSSRLAGKGDLTGDLGVGHLLLTEARRAAEEPSTDQASDPAAAEALRSELSDAASAVLSALDPEARAAAALVEPGSGLVPPARCPAENVLVLSWLALQLLQSPEGSPPEEAVARALAARATARAMARLDAGAMSELVAQLGAADAALTARRRRWAQALEALRADASPAATVTPYRNGPYLLRGNFRLLDEDGHEIDARRETVALCRCGRSRMRPFCDGTHTVVGFTAPGRLEPADRRVDPIAPD